MPKAPSPFDEDEEKTTIESGWEEEASTTVEQGDVADKIRALGVEPPRQRHNITGITNTNGGLGDEHTVDDQRANAGLSLIAQAAAARLVITSGSDAGQEIDIRPGKSYTIGRAIDNDIVLTDIAVSRKHFDLRHEGGSWVLADRGSGNGTVVNGNVEDHPFMLANGDLIEIGNTTFRFDHQGATRTAATFDGEEEEPSTVAGKAMRVDDAPLPVMAPPRPAPRPKTAPPPAPLPRPRAPSSAPLSYPPLGAQGSHPPHPAYPNSVPIMPAAMPLPAPQPMPLPHLSPMHGRPLGGPHAPTMLGGDGMRPQMLGNHDGMSPLQNMMPTTIPGQGPPVSPSAPQVQYGYPNIAEMQKQHALVVNGNGHRGDASTAHVAPTPYSNMMPMPMAATYGQPASSSLLSRRTKLLMGGAALTLFAAIATIAIIKSSSSPGAGKPAAKPTASSTSSTPAKSAGESTTPNTTTPTVTPPAAVEDPKPTPAVVQNTKTEPSESTKDTPVETVTATPPAPAPESAKVAAVEPTKPPPPAPPPPIAKPEPVKPKTVAKPEPKRTVARPEPKPRPVAKKPPKEREKPPKRVATADDPRGKADQLYRNGKFNDAAATLRSAGDALGGQEGSSLRSDAAAYKEFGQLYNRGMAPGTKTIDAYASLQCARNYDNSLGRNYVDQINTKLAQLAPTAAIAYLAAKDYPSAREAVRVAEKAGAGGSSAKLVRTKLESIAGELYSSAAREIDSNPDAAKTKLKQIKSMVESSSPWYQKATKLLSNS